MRAPHIGRLLDIVPHALQFFPTLITWTKKLCRNWSFGGPQTYSAWRGPGSPSGHKRLIISCTRYCGFSCAVLLTLYRDSINLLLRITWYWQRGAHQHTGGAAASQVPHLTSKSKLLVGLTGSEAAHHHCPLPDKLAHQHPHLPANCINYKV